METQEVLAARMTRVKVGSGLGFTIFGCESLVGAVAGRSVAEWIGTGVGLLTGAGDAAARGEVKPAVEAGDGDGFVGSEAAVWAIERAGIAGGADEAVLRRCRAHNARASVRRIRGMASFCQRTGDVELGWRMSDSGWDS